MICRGKKDVCTLKVQWNGRGCSVFKYKFFQKRFIFLLKDIAMGHNIALKNVMLVILFCNHCLKKTHKRW